MIIALRHHIHNLLRSVLCLLLIGLSYWPARALTFPLPADPHDNIVGEIQVITVEPGDTISQLARYADVGVQELLSANPNINPKRLKRGQEIIIPTAFVLPNAPRNGIIINLAELRLYFFPAYQDIVMTFPIGIGREGWETPLTQTYVFDKTQNPFWIPPDSIREYTLKTKGYELPKIVYAGPDNPLGDYAIRLALTGYLIHGTNQPNSVGKRSSSGCIRMLPEDIEQLFYQVDAGTPVYIIYEPNKIGKFQSELYLEAHQPLNEYFDAYDIRQQIANLTQNSTTNIDWKKANSIITKQMGFPILISRDN